MLQMVSVNVMMVVLAGVLMGLVAGEPKFLNLGGKGCRPHVRHVPHYKTIVQKVRLHLMMSSNQHS